MDRRKWIILGGILLLFGVVVFRRLHNSCPGCQERGRRMMEFLGGE